MGKLGNPLQSYGASLAIYSVTCHPTQVNAPRHPHAANQAGTRFTYPEGWKAELTLVLDNGPTGKWESNPRPLDSKSDTLTVTPPSHHYLSRAAA